MARVTNVVVYLSSASTRILSYVFLRWIPGHPFPPLIITSVVVYLGAVLSCHTKDLFVPDQTLNRSEANGSARTKSKAVQAGTASGVRKNDMLGVPSISAADEQTSILWTILSGRPNSRHQYVNWWTMLVNVLLTCMVVDLTYGPKWFYPSHDLSFVRVGFVAHDSAKILIREPDSSRLPIKVDYRLQPEMSDDTVRAWTTVAEVTGLDGGSDFTTGLEIPYLLPNTRYQYQISNGHTGIFTTAAGPGTNPTGTFTFLHSSCIVPNFPYVPFRHHLSFPGFAHLSRLLPDLKAQFMLFLGDFIYIDVPHRHGTDQESYRREYRQVYASPDWPSVSSSTGTNTSLPWIHVYDDHEIANDWDKNETGVYRSAADPFTHYQASVNPSPHRPNVSYFSFTQGPAAFFLIDTRRYRTPFDGTPGHWTNTSLPISERKSMLGAQQREDLLTWLSTPVPRGVKWRVIVSSIPFTKNWRFGSEDTWAGYLGERKVMLEAMWSASQQQGTGIIVLSGDRHEFAATKFPPPQVGEVLPAEQAGAGHEGEWKQEAAVHEFSASPLSMFYLPIRTYRQEDREDVALKYLPDGNSKFGAVSIRGGGRLDYRLFIDGEEAWSYTLPPPGEKEERKGWGIWG